jgi:hypothetical protein
VVLAQQRELAIGPETPVARSGGYWADDADGRPVFHIPDNYDHGDPTFN